MATTKNTNTEMNTTVINPANEMENETMEMTNETNLNENEMECTVNNNENEVLIDTLFSVDTENKPVESKTWNEPCFLDRMGASTELKEWANQVSELFWRRNETGYSDHPDWTVVSVPKRFRDEVRALREGSLPYSPGMVVHPGVWYYPADREFEIVE